MDELTTTQGLVAVGAAAVALLALLFCIVLAVKVRRLRAAQRTVLGPGGQDIVQHSAALHEAFIQLRDWVEETAAGLEERVAGAEQRMEGCVAHMSLVRYDAMNDLSGQQSSSVALLDSRRTGVVISSILHRDQARVYVKELHEGNSEYELSPEEQEAVAVALSETARGSSA